MSVRIDLQRGQMRLYHRHALQRQMRRHPNRCAELRRVRNGLQRRPTELHMELRRRQMRPWLQRQPDGVQQRLRRHDDRQRELRGVRYLVRQPNMLRRRVRRHHLEQLQLRYMRHRLQRRQDLHELDMLVVRRPQHRDLLAQRMQDRDGAHEQLRWQHAVRIVRLLARFVLLQRVVGLELRRRGPNLLRLHLPRLLSRSPVHPERVTDVIATRARVATLG